MLELFFIPLETNADLNKKIDLDALKKGFPELNEYRKAKEDAYGLVLTSEGVDSIVLPKQIVQAETGELFLVKADGDNNSITDLDVHFLLMFLLSHIARYKAPLLSEILDGRKSSENVALIEKFISISETKFPKLVLDEISGQYFVFKS